MCPPSSICPSIPIITPSRNSLPHFEKAIHSLREFPLVVEGNCATPLHCRRAPPSLGPTINDILKIVGLAPFPLLTVPLTQLTAVCLRAKPPFPLSADVRRCFMHGPLFSLRSHASGAVKDLRIPRIANAPSSLFLLLPLHSILGV